MTAPSAARRWGRPERILVRHPELETGRASDVDQTRGIRVEPRTGASRAGQLDSSWCVANRDGRATGEWDAPERQCFVAIRTRHDHEFPMISREAHRAGLLLRRVVRDSGGEGTRGSGRDRNRANTIGAASDDSAVRETAAHRDHRLAVGTYGMHWNVDVRRCGVDHSLVSRRHLMRHNTTWRAVTGHVRRVVHRLPIRREGDRRTRVRNDRLRLVGPQIETEEAWLAVLVVGLQKNRLCSRNPNWTRRREDSWEELSCFVARQRPDNELVVLKPFTFALHEGDVLPVR